MSRLRVFAFAVLGLLSFSGHSFAVESPPGVGVDEPFDPYSEEFVETTEIVPVYIWDGAYVGIHGGWARLHDTNRFNNSGSQYNGGTVGLYGGYNYTYENLLIGVEGEGAYWAFGERSRGNIALRSDYFVSAKARVGLTYGRFLAYVNGGAAVSTFRVSNSIFGPGTDSNTMLGWVGGAGVEVFLTQNLLVRLDYEQIVFPGRRFTVGNTRFKENIDSDALRIGLTYKF